MVGPDRRRRLRARGPAAPAEGLAYGARQLHRRGLDKTRTALVLGLEQWFSYLVAALNLLVIIASRDFPVPGLWPVLGAVTVLVALLATAGLASRPASMEHFSSAWASVRFWTPQPSAEERRRTGVRLHETAMSVVGTPWDGAGYTPPTPAGEIAMSYSVHGNWGEKTRIGFLSLSSRHVPDDR